MSVFRLLGHPECARGQGRPSNWPVSGRVGSPPRAEYDHRRGLGQGEGGRERRRTRAEPRLLSHFDIKADHISQCDLLHCTEEPLTWPSRKSSSSLAHVGDYRPLICSQVMAAAIMLVTLPNAMLSPGRKPRKKVCATHDHIPRSIET